MGKCLFMRKGEVHTVPSVIVPRGYTLLSYIESSGTQYIDTGVLANTITNSFIDFKFVVTGSTELEVMSAYVDGTNKMQCGWSGTAFMTGAGATYSQTSSSTARTTATVKPVGSPALSVYLFAQNENTVKWPCSAKIYACQINTNDGMVRDFVPCINPNGEVGLYDRTTRAFYGNSGTGVFIAGHMLPEAYTELAYIESTGTQYIDTGVIPTNGSTAKVGFQATSVNSNESWILAEYESGTVNFRAGFVSGSFGTTYGFSYSQTSSKTDYTVATGKCTCNPTLSLYLFGQQEPSGAVHVANSKHKLYYCELYDASGKIVRNFVPAKRNSDGTIGLYDHVTQTFFTNAGTGTFSYKEVS